MTMPNITKKDSLIGSKDNELGVKFTSSKMQFSPFLLTLFLNNAKDRCLKTMNILLPDDLPNM